MSAYAEHIKTVCERFDKALQIPVLNRPGLLRSATSRFS